MALEVTDDDWLDGAIVMRDLKKRPRRYEKKMNECGYAFADEVPVEKMSTLGVMTASISPVSNPRSRQ